MSCNHLHDCDRCYDELLYNSSEYATAEIKALRKALEIACSEIYESCIERGRDTIKPDDYYNYYYNAGHNAS